MPRGCPKRDRRSTEKVPPASGGFAVHNVIAALKSASGPAVGAALKFPANGVQSMPDRLKLLAAMWFASFARSAPASELQKSAVVQPAIDVVGNICAVNDQSAVRSPRLSETYSVLIGVGVPV